MFVKNVKLLNFRNYEFGKVSFTPGSNVIYGKNALGKTNVLESVFLLATSKSHRFAKEKEMIMYDKDMSKISIEFFSENRDKKGDIILNRNKKKQFIKNNVPVTRTSEIMGFLKAVMFCPEDLRLVKGSPRDRRRMIDMGICQLRAKYFKSLINYNRVLEQKNNLLRINSDSNQLWVWNEQLAEFGSYIAFTRQNYLHNLNMYAEKYHSEIAKEKLSLVYNSGICSEGRENLSQEDYYNIMLNEMKNNEGREKRQEMSLVGPHRDDFSVFINDKEAKMYASQGQQRTSALCLKLAEVDIIKNTEGEAPVLLLDDALSELDKERQKFVLKTFNDLQTIISCTHADDFEGNGNINFIRVEDIHVHSYGK